MDPNNPYSEVNSERYFQSRPTVITLSRCDRDAEGESQTEIVSPSKIYSCEVCESNFRSSLQLNKHIQKFKLNCKNSIENRGDS